jgi:hypothetical protein
MSYWRHLHYHHPQRQSDRWTWETLNKAPRMPHPLPGEIEEGWDIYRILEEIERLRPIIEAARKEWFERRKAEMPPEVKAWIAEKAAARVRPRTPASPTTPSLTRTPLACHCGQPVTQPRAGHPRLYCSAKCAKRAEYARAKERKANGLQMRKTYEH